MSSRDRSEPATPSITPATTTYSREAVSAGLTKFQSQTLWLLFSLDHYGWRAHADIAHRLIATVPDKLSDEELHETEHAVMEALDQLFRIVDLIWRVVAGIRTHAKGGDFLDDESGFSAYGGKIAKKYENLKALTADDWAAILRVPSEATLRQVLSEHGAGEEEIDEQIAIAREVPALAATNMDEVAKFFDRPGTRIEERKEGFSLRDLNNTYRHGGRLLYEDCAPTDSGWIVTNLEESSTGDASASDLSREGTVTVLMQPPDESGRAFLGSMSYGKEMRDSLMNACALLSALLHRIVRSFLFAELMGIQVVLASIDRYEWEPRH